MSVGRVSRPVFYRAWTTFRCFRNESIPYLCSGSLASNFFGIPRSTRDADFVVQMGDKSVTCLGSHLGPEFAIERQIAFGTIT
jgi:hypothetical protein